MSYSVVEAAGPSGFWSYVHKDNEQSGGRILRLSKRIADEFSLITGQDLEMFVDRDAISWGDEWRLRINVALQETTFFIPVITPRYFTSQECRNELLKFSGHARSLGAEELLLPILYVNVEDLNEDSGDEAKALIAKTQYSDWRDLRLVDEDSAEYARAVNTLAGRLAEVSRTYSARPTLVPEELASQQSASQTGVDEEPGLVDLMADLEGALPQWQETLEAFPEPMGEISAITKRATERIQEGDRQRKGFAHRVLVAREMASELAEPAQRMENLGEQYAAQLLRIDPGVRALISVASEPDRSDEDQRAACEMFRSLQGLVKASRENSTAIQGFVGSLRDPARQFRDLRPALAKIETGLRSVLDGQTILEEWDRLIDEAPIDCANRVGS